MENQFCPFCQWATDQCDCWDPVPLVVKRPSVELVNLTPHTINLVVCGETRAIPSSGVARVTSTPGGEIFRGEGFYGDCGLCGGQRHQEMLQAGEGSSSCGCFGLPLYEAPVMGAVEGLPKPKAGTIYVVSAIVASACKGRKDVFSPGTGPNDGAIREGGQIKAVTRLIQAPQA